MADFHIPTAAIIGGDSLLGREVRDLLNDLKPSPDVKLLAGEPGSVKMACDDSGEALVMAPIDEAGFDGVDVVFLAGSADAALKALELAGEKGPALIDVAGTLEDNPRARLRAPLLEQESKRPADAIDVIAHPAALALARFYLRLSSRFVLTRSVVEVFEPASERGQAGITELQKQAVNLLAFKPLPKDVYDAQLGYAMLAEYGRESPHNLVRIEALIDRHLASLLSSSARAPMPSLRLIQAPVFHGYSCSVWVELAEAPGVAAIEEAIACASIEVRRADEEAPNNVGVAGESGVIAGAIRADRNNPRAYWLWLVTDNLRISAEAAVAVAREHL